MYWKNEGEYAIEDARIDCNGISEVDIYQDLVRSRIVSESDGMVQIQFLDEQLSDLVKQSDSKRRAAQSRWNKSAKQKDSTSNADGMHVHSTSNADKNKKENRKEKKRLEKKEIVFPWNDKSFMDQWEIWKEYKLKEHRFKFKSPISEQAQLKALANLSNGSMETAIKIIHQSISNGYKGLFALKQQHGTPDSRGFGTDNLNDFINQ